MVDKDLLGEALARVDSIESLGLEPQTDELILAAARNWHTLTAVDDDLVQVALTAWWDHVDGSTDQIASRDAWRAALQAVVDALTDTADE